MYIVEGGTCKTNRNEQGGGGSKTGSSKWTHFLNGPLIKILRIFRLHYQKQKSQENLMFMYASSGQNKINLNEKEKKLTQDNLIAAKM